jgi:hypothetical protein
MTDERDPGVSAAYRSLSAEEPPRALDEAILAAARRPRISPARTWTRRWALPLSLAAVVLLSVTVTLQMQLEQPGLDGPQAPRPAATAKDQPLPQPQPLKLKAEEQLQTAAKPQARQEARRAEPKAFAEAGAGRAPKAASGPAAEQAPAAAAPPPVASGSLASRADSGSSEDSSYGDSALRREENRAAHDAEAAARAPQAAAVLAKRPAAGQAVKQAAETPEQELERIAKLRAEGRHEEADKALAEFRKRHPDYRIGEDLLRRVERR